MNTDTTGGLFFAAGLDNASLLRSAQEARQALQGIGQEATQQGTAIDHAFSQIKSAAAGFLSVQAAQGFVSQMVRVRSEIQNLEVSFSTLLGSKERADQLMADIKEYAVKTPLELSDLAGATQTLMGFGVQADKAMPIMKQLGDISMGNAERFRSLSLAYAQASAS